MTAIRFSRVDGAHATVVGAGTAAAGAAALVEATNFLTSETGQTAFILPAQAQSGMVVKGGTVAALVYPSTGGAINGASVNASFSVTAAKTAIFTPLNDGTGLNWLATLSA